MGGPRLWQEPPVPPRPQSALLVHATSSRTMPWVLDSSRAALPPLLLGRCSQMGRVCSVAVWGCAWVAGPHGFGEGKCPNVHSRQRRVTLREPVPRWVLTPASLDMAHIGRPAWPLHKPQEESETHLPLVAMRSEPGSVNVSCVAAQRGQAPLAHAVGPLQALWPCGLMIRGQGPGPGCCWTSPGHPWTWRHLHVTGHRLQTLVCEVGVTIA